MTRVIYSILTHRRETYDELIWQKPALSLMAQAFLLTIAVNATSSLLAREVASALGILVNVATIQMMYKNRIAEEMDSILIERFEKDLDGLRLHKKPVGPPEPEVDELRDEGSKRVALNELEHRLAMANRLRGPTRGPLRANRLQLASAFDLWIAGLSVFCVADAAIMAIAWLAPAWLA